MPIMDGLELTKKLEWMNDIVKYQLLLHQV